jgi:thiamine biosynthesis lipoprotein
MTAAVLLLCTACAPAPQPQLSPPLRAELIVFGGSAEIQLRARNAAANSARLADISLQFAEFDRDWHAWRDSALTRFNTACARGEAHPLPASLRAMLLRSQQLNRQSQGLFDPGIGGLIRLWGFHTSEYPIHAPAPSPAALTAWLQSAPSVQQVELVGADQARCLNPAVQLDFGAIAEGAALREVGARLRARGVRHALLNLGGDVLALGDAGGRPWRLGVRDPAGGVLLELPLHDGEGLFTSGGYAKYRENPDGSRWPHLLDPRTASPVVHSLAASVIHADPELADAAATALMIGGPERFEALCQSMNLGLALLLDANDVLHLTPAMAARIEIQREPAGGRVLY